MTYAGDKKDVFFLYRCFLRPEEPTVEITSKRYFLRRGAVDNGIKAYSTAPTLSLTLNGATVSTLNNGDYIQPDGPWAHHASKKTQTGSPAASPTPAAAPISWPPQKIDNVFYWKVPFHTGKNVVAVSDGKGHGDSAVFYFQGEHGLPPLIEAPPAIRDLTSSNPRNPGFYMEMPAHAQWPIYYDLDSTADNSWDVLPPELEGATWIALRRVTKEDQATEIGFTATRAMKVYVMTTESSTPPPFVSNGKFKPAAPSTPRWRDNALLLVPTQLFVHEAAAGEMVRIPLGDRDALVLLR